MSPSDASIPSVPRKRFPALDTMRAIGALAVLTTHVGFNAGAYTDILVLGPILARMDVGVALFFVLSGFLLARPWFLSVDGSAARPWLRRYFQHRFFRIVPAYLVTALIALTLLPSNDELGPLQWVKALTMTDIYFSLALPFGLTQTWSLATEVAFYVVLPLLMLIAVPRTRTFSRHRAWVLLGALVVLNVVWTLWLSARVPSHPAHVNEWLPSFLTWFSAGIALAMTEADQGRRSSTLVSRLGRLPGVCWTAVIALLLVASTAVAGPLLLVPASGVQSLTKNLLYTAIAVLATLPAIFGDERSRYIRGLSHRFLTHLGKISYSIFLIHMSVLHLVMWMTGYELFEGHLLQIWVLTVVLSLAAAELLYRFVEVPAMRLKDWGLRTNRGRRSAASVSSDATTKITR